MPFSLVCVSVGGVVDAQHVVAGAAVDRRRPEDRADVDHVVAGIAADRQHRLGGRGADMEVVAAEGAERDVDLLEAVVLHAHLDAQPRKAAREGGRRIPRHGCRAFQHAGESPDAGDAIAAVIGLEDVLAVLAEDLQVVAEDQVQRAGVRVHPTARRAHPNQVHPATGAHDRGAGDALDVDDVLAVADVHDGDPHRVGAVGAVDVEDVAVERERLALRGERRGDRRDRAQVDLQQLQAGVARCRASCRGRAAGSTTRSPTFSDWSPVSSTIRTSLPAGALLPAPLTVRRPRIASTVPPVLVNGARVARVPT